MDKEVITLEQNKLNFILIALNIVIFISYFAISNLYIRDGMNEKLKNIEKYTMEENWKKAKETSIDIEKDWRKKKVFITCNYGEAEFHGFEDDINEITGSIEAESVDAALTTILSAQDAWRNLNKIIPAP